MAKMKNGTVSHVMRQLVKRRWQKTSKAEAKEYARKAVNAYWAKLTPEERSAEMKRRAAKRKQTAKGKKP